MYDRTGYIPIKMRRNEIVKRAEPEGTDQCSRHVGPAYAPDTQVARLDGALGTELVLELDELPTGRYGAPRRLRHRRFRG